MPRLGIKPPPIGQKIGCMASTRKTCHQTGRCRSCPSTMTSEMQMGTDRVKKKVGLTRERTLEGLETKQGGNSAKIRKKSQGR